MRENAHEDGGVDTTSEERYRLAQKMKVRCRPVGIHIDKYPMASRIADRADMADVTQWKAARQIERELLAENGLTPTDIPKSKRQMFNWEQHSGENRFDDTVDGFWIPWEEERQRREKIQTAEENLTPVGNADEADIKAINRRVGTAATRESTNTPSDDSNELTDSWLFDGIASPIAGWINAINGVVSSNTSSTESTAGRLTSTRSVTETTSPTPTAGIQQVDTPTYNSSHSSGEKTESSGESQTSSNNTLDRTHKGVIGFFTGWANETVGIVTSLFTLLLQTVLMTIVGVAVVVALSYILAMVV